MIRDTVWFFWRLTRPLSRLIFPAPGAGGGGVAGAAGGAAGVETGGAGGCTGAGGGVIGWGGAAAAGSSTVTPKSVAMPARPLAYPWPTARAFHCPPRW